MAAYISFDKILYLIVYFVFKRNLAIFHITQGYFQQMPIDLGIHFQNCKYFLGYFGFYLLTTIYTKKGYQKFFFIFSFPKLQRQSKFSFLQTVQSRHSTSYLGMSHFSVKCQYCFLALIFLQTLKKILWKNYVRFWKWNLERTPQSTQNSFSRKSNLHYIQHNFICMLKSVQKSVHFHVQKIYINYFNRRL